MKRIFSLSLIVALASHVQAQQKDPPKNFTNTIGMKFVWIAPGTFLMGSPKEEKGRQPNETQHKVTLTKGFYMGVYTVTQEQWQAVMGNNPSRFKDEKNLPVEQVFWEDCQEFIKKMREKDKKPYHLPTEAEWEYSCRAGTKTAFHFGETMSGDQANHIASGRVFRKKTTPVGSFPPNAFGLYDMHGNVWEWCQDWYWYDTSPQNDVVDPQGPPTNTGKGHVMRGGSCFTTDTNCRSAKRWFYPPNLYFCVGFRLCFFDE